MDSKTITISRWKTILYLCASLTFVIGSAFLLQHPDPEAWKLQFCLVFFGIGAVVFVWLLIRPQQLLLDRGGFTLTGGFVRSPKKVLWRDIDRFSVYRLPRGGPMVVYTYTPEARLSRKATANRLLGFDGGLPKGWPQSPKRMVEDLNAYCARAKGAPRGFGAARFG